MVVLGTLLITAFAAALTVIGYIVGVAASAPDIESLRPDAKGQTSIVYAANGKRLGFIESDEVRTLLPGHKLPKVLREATVAAEDERYFRHQGIDYEGVVRAAIKNLRSGRTVQGGSTITMQLVRNLYLHKPKRDFKRKIREAKLAEELENRKSKEQILTDYLNSIPYGTVGGQTAVGAEAASRMFFNKPASELNLREAALLAGLPRAPSLYNPLRDPETALARRNNVLQRMLRQGLISPEQAAEAQKAPLKVRPNSYYTTRRAAYFFDFVKDQLIKRYGIGVVRKGGLRIYTTIDLRRQEAAKEAMAGYVYDGGPAAAIVSIDPRNGYIRAMASSSSYGRNKFNYAAQGHRQAGSTFKVMVLMAALRQGIDPNRTVYVSRPLNLKTEYGPWKVETYGKTYLGSVNLVEATARSDNTVFAQLDLDVGPEEVRKAAYDLGIQTKLDALPAEGLGGMRLGVSPLEMANAFATIAAGGVRHKPIAIKKVVFPEGETQDLGRPSRSRAFSEGVAHEAIKVLQRVVQGGTGTRANIGCPVAGKTGTVDDYTDAWFVGFTPKLATSVWVGYPDAKIPMWGMTGGSTPAGIWHDYMVRAVGNDCGEFKVPKKSAKFAPFFGRYARTGSRYDTDYSYRGYRGYRGYRSRYSAPSDEGSIGRSGGGRYNPEYYEAPPQRGSQTGGGGGPGGGGGGGPSDGGGGGGQGGGTSAGGAQTPG
jgi:penicillin-binding protein 1A